MTKKSNITTRRAFIAQTGMLTTGITFGVNQLSAISYNRIMGANDKIRMGFIGIGNRGTIEMGYRAIALKAIAKTLSMTMKIAQAAFERDVPCFCADLTVNPILVEWNKNVAARLKTFPGLGSLGLLESNGHQNYKNWNTLVSYHPRKDASWVKVNHGLYQLGDDFYSSGGGIFDPVPHYEEMFADREQIHTNIKFSH